MNNNVRLRNVLVLMLVSVLLLSGLGLAFTDAAPNSGSGNSGLSNANESMPSSTPRQGQHVQSVAPTNIPVAFVGEQDFDLDVILESIHPDDYDDTNGDNVIYTAEIKGSNVNGTTLQKYNFNTRQFQAQTTPVFTWQNSLFNPTSSDMNDIYLYHQGNPPMGAWKYVVNQSNSYLDEDNDGTIDAGEYWAIQDGDKTFSGLELNVLGTAKPGYYRIYLEITYWVQDYAPLNTTGIGTGATSTLASTSLWTNEALGAFDYYYWLPWNTSINSVPSDLDDTYMNDSANFDFHKVANHQAPQNPIYSNIWEAIPDNGAATPNSHPDINNDGYNSWLPSYPYAGGSPRFDINADFASIISNYPFPPMIDQHSNSQNDNAYAGNGSWRYSGYVPDFTWQEYTDKVYVDLIINSTVEVDSDLNEDNITNDLKLEASDDDYFTGSTFEEFFIQMHNVDPAIEMRDVEAKLTLPTLTEGGLTFYKEEFDTCKVTRIDPDETVKMKYRITIEKDTPPGYYWGGLTLMYTKRYPTGNFDPLGNPLTTDVRVTENHWVIRIMIDFTPDLGNAKVMIPELAVRAKPTTQIDVSTGKQLFEFTVYNTGNVELFGGNKTNGNLHLSFAEFKQMGQDYFDSDADPGIELDPINIDSIDVGESVQRLIPVNIPHHWYLEEGIYRLYLNFSGYYFDNGALDDPTGFVYMQMDWEGMNDDNDNRTCMVKIDEDGDGKIDLDGTDSARITDGIYTDIYINKFDPATKELAIIDYTPKEIRQEELERGSQDFTITLQNQQSYIMYNVYVEVDIEGYFDESYYYDWTNPVSRQNPKFYTPMLDPTVNNGTWMLNFTIDDVDRLLPDGEHHIPIKYSYDYEDYPGVEEMSTFSVIWDTGSIPFKPYVDANADFMLNKGVITRAGSNAFDIVFIVDGTSYNSMSSYRSYLEDSIDDFVHDLSAQNIDYQLAVVGFNQDSWVAQDFTTDANKIELAIDSMPNSGSCGVHDAVIETIRNIFVGQKLSYRPGATKVVILHSNYYPNQGTNDETAFALACKGECVFFAIANTGYWSYYDLASINTGGQLFNSYAGSSNYPGFMSTIAYSLSGYQNGVSSTTGMPIFDVPLRDVINPTSVDDVDTYGPYLIVNVVDTGLDIETRVTSSPISLGGRVRNINMNVQLTNREYVRYSDIEIMLPLKDKDNTTVFINPLGTTEPIKGSLSSTTLSPDGGVLTATFNLDVDTTISSGIYVMHLEFVAMNDYTKQLVTGVIPVEVRIYPREPILIIPQIDQNSGKASVTAKAEPGEEFYLTFTIQNVGDDVAREVYLTLSNDWYTDDPFNTIEGFITAYYPEGSGGDIINSPDSNIVGASEKCDRKLSDLGIASTSDIIDAERQLLAPTAVVPRYYIKEIVPGGSVEVKFKLEADTHMVKGRPYKEYILVEYMDSDGLVYRYDETNPELSTQPLPIIIHTTENDEWAEEDFSNTLFAIVLVIVIIIIIIALILISVINKRKMDDEGRPPFDMDEELEEEDIEEDLGEEDEELEEELPAELKEEKTREPEWDAEDEDIPEPEDEDEEKGDEDWDIEEDTSSPPPAKGKIPIRGKSPKPVPAGKAPAESDEIEDW